jgi:hypothetical protein
VVVVVWIHVTVGVTFVVAVVVVFCRISSVEENKRQVSEDVDWWV